MPVADLQNLKWFCMIPARAFSKASLVFFSRFAVKLAQPSDAMPARPAREEDPPQSCRCRAKVAERREHPLVPDLEVDELIEDLASLHCSELHCLTSP